MPEHTPLSEADEADLAALADGRLDAARREALEARLASDPVLEQAMARQRAGLTAIVSARESTSAPMALRARVEQMQQEATAPRRRRRLRLPAAGRWLPVAGLTATAAVAAVVVLVLGGGPTTQDMVAAALRPPVAAVSIDSDTPALLEQDVEGTQFPNYGPKLAATPDGTRTDEIDGRDTRTVFYMKDGEQVAYTIVSGDALAWPEDARRTTRDGVELRTFQEDGRTVVTWRRDGRTCVMSAAGLDERTLIDLAVWPGEGAVTF
jgi:hypothetical protein